jgi:hypothetical protein
VSIIGEGPIMRIMWDEVGVLAIMLVVPVAVVVRVMLA